MRNLKFVLLILNLTFFGVFVGCSANSGNTSTSANNGPPQNTAADSLVTVNKEYPQAVADEFVTACEGTGAKREECECVFEKVKLEYSFEEFSEIEARITAGETADDFVAFSEKAGAECLK